MVRKCMMDEHCAGVSSDEAGGSILELVLCLGLAMLLVSSALPRCVQMDRLQLKYEALCLLNDLRYVQSWSHGMDYCHVENYDKKPAQPSLAISQGAHYVYHQMKVMNWRKVENGMKMYTNRAKFQFSPRGHSTAGTVVLQKGGHEQRVVVDTVGRVRLEERQI